MEEKLPHFFKLMMPGFDTKIRLPPLISSILVKDEPEEALLTSQKGSWRVEIQKCEQGRLWFTKGWSDFIWQHRVAPKDLVMFEHIGNLHFNVKLFDKTCTERDFSDELTTKNKRRGTQGETMATSHESYCFENNFPETINNVSVKSEEGEEEEEEAPTPVKAQKPDMNRCSAKRKKNDPCDEKKRNSEKPSPELVRIMEPYNLRSRSPYMHIPADFCTANGLYQDARITLKSPSYEQEVSLKICKGGKTKYAVLTRGWPEFITGNNLREKDICIFKLRDARSSLDQITFDVEVYPRGA